MGDKGTGKGTRRLDNGMSWLTDLFRKRQKARQTPQADNPSAGVNIPEGSKDAVFFGEEIHVGSTNVASFRFDVKTSTLYVRFLNGSLYEYLEVPIEVAYKAIDTDSPGRFVWNSLRDVYLYKQLEPATKRRPKAQVIRVLDEGRHH
jgi:KTSC domain